MATNDVFGRIGAKSILSRAVKPTTIVPPLTAAQRLARQRQLAMQNEQLSPSGPTSNPQVTQSRTAGARIGANGQIIDDSAAQRIVNPFAALASGGGSMPQGNAGSSPALGTVSAAAAQAGGIGNLLAGTGANAGTGGAFPTGSGYTAQTKLGRSFLDMALPDAWNDPEALIDTYYRTMGLAKGSGDYGRQLDDADNLGMLYLALNGADAGRGNAHFVDWAANYLANGRTADGVSISPGEIWNAISNPEANSPLNYYLNNPSLTPEDQVNNFMSAARYGLEQTLPAPVLNAYLAQIDQMGRDFRSLRNTQTGSATFTDYLGSRPGSTPAFF